MGEAAIAKLRELLREQPNHPEAWRALADQLMAIGETAEADAAYLEHTRCAAGHPQLQAAATAMLENDIPRAESLLKSHLKRAPTDVPAIRMLAEVAVRCGEEEAAERLLTRCLELAPNFTAARYNHAILLHRRNKVTECLAEVERLLWADPRNPSYRNLHAVVLSRVGDVQRSSEIYAKLLREYPRNAKVWLSYGHVLKTAGRRDDCVTAYRNCLALEPALGEAYWSLANLKTFRFTDQDLQHMRQHLENTSLETSHRVHLHFAMGKAMEDAGDYRESFAHYERGNRLQRERQPYDAKLNAQRMQRLKRVFTREFFAERSAAGHEAADPIFIVGMPRAGSTLLEQILSSHSAVEGTSELPDVIALARELRARAADPEGGYASTLAALTPAELRELGERYLHGTRVHRKTTAALPTDHSRKFGY